VGPTEQKRYYTDMGAMVDFHMNPEYGHNYPEDTIAGKVSNWCYKSRDGLDGISDETKPYKWEKGWGPDNIPKYYSQGYFRKFDQFEFAKKLYLDQDKLGV